MKMYNSILWSVMRLMPWGGWRRSRLLICSSLMGAFDCHCNPLVLPGALALPQKAQRSTRVPLHPILWGTPPQIWTSYHYMK